MARREVIAAFLDERARRAEGCQHRLHPAPSMSVQAQDDRDLRSQAIILLSARRFNHNRAPQSDR
jgi:hypothetical protein